MPELWTIPLWFLLVHWFADFVLQTDWQAENKSKNNVALTRHVSTYSLCWLPLGISFAAVTFVTHWLTDWVTSRINSRLYKAGKIHEFFVSVGFDQVIHYVTLALTYYWLVNQRG